eukprot:3027610-Pyramimonas_sp.AAC.1
MAVAEVVLVRHPLGEYPGRQTNRQLRSQSLTPASPPHRPRRHSKQSRQRDGWLVVLSCLWGPSLGSRAVKLE